LDKCGKLRVDTSFLDLEIWERFRIFGINN
jgi:hypothetical protein